MPNSYEKDLAKAKKALPKAQARYEKLNTINNAAMPENETEGPYEDKVQAAYEKVDALEYTIRLCNEALRVSACVPDAMIINFIDAGMPDKLEEWADDLAHFIDQYSPNEHHTRYMCTADIKEILKERFEALCAKRKRSA